MLTIYTTFFSIMLRARWHGAETDTHANYAIVLFVGLIVHVSGFLFGFKLAGIYPALAGPESAHFHHRTIT